MEKRTIELSQLKGALIETFNHYSWDTTDYDVWCGIREFFAESLWRNLGGEELRQNEKPNDLKVPQTCKHEKHWLTKESEVEKQYYRIFWRFYFKSNKQ
jgi:hypothetical protein